MDQLRIDIIDGRLSTHGFALRTRPLSGGTEVRLVPLAQTVSDPAALYARLLADAADPVAFLEAVEPINGPDPALLRIRLNPHGRVATSRQQDTALTVHTQWEDPPQSFLADARIPVSTVLLERALRIRGALVTRTDRNFLVGSAPDGTPLLVKDARSHLNGMPAVHAAERKDIARALLARTDVAVPAGTAFDRTADPAGAFELLERLGAVVVKPVDGDKGRGVTVGVTDPGGLREAWDLALHETRAGVLVEEIRSGEEVRVLVIDGRARAAARRIPPHVTGDGERTIRELVNAKNARRQESFFLHGKSIALTRHRLRLLADAGLTPLSVLERGRRYELDVTGNVRTGAEAVDATDTIDPSYLRIAERAVAAVPGLRVAGVDLIGTDLASPAAAGDHVVIELNPNPGLGIHAGAQAGRPRDVAGAIADAVLDVQRPALASPPPHPRIAAAETRRPAGPQVPAVDATSHTLLARSFASRGFTIDPIAEDAFFAYRGSRTHGVWNALTDRSSPAAVFALRNPNAAHELLTRVGVPVFPGRGFTRADRGSAHTYAARWGQVAVHGGSLRPLLVDPASPAAFAAAWDAATSSATFPGMRVTRGPAGRIRRILLAHGEVLAVVEENGGVTADEHVLGIARAAVEALPGLDLAEVVLASTDEGDAVLHIRADPDLLDFSDETSGAREDLADRVVALHLRTSS